jgi:hypothetical protein
VHRPQIGRVTQIEIGASLTLIDTEMLGEGVGIGWGSDMEHIRAIFRERTGTAGASQNVREVENTKALQWGGRTSVERHGRTVGYFLDLDNRYPAQCSALV